jgi:hypothetical protein
MRALHFQGPMQLQSTEPSTQPPTHISHQGQLLLHGAGPTAAVEEDLMQDGLLLHCMLLSQAPAVRAAHAQANGAQQGHCAGGQVVASTVLRQVPSSQAGAAAGVGKDLQASWLALHIKEGRPLLGHRGWR